MTLRLTTGATPDQITAAVNGAAAKYNVPQWVMWGMFDNESSLGQVIKTSSTGAMGPFQFEPQTAARYGYPMTNSPNASQWQQQADASAHYLSDLFHQLGGSWSNALGGYYAGPGGYQSAAAQSYAQKAQANGHKVISQGYSTAANTSISNNPISSGISSVTDSISGAINGLIGDAKYAGVLLVVLGVAAYLVVHGLTGASPRDVARRAVP